MSDRLYNLLPAVYRVRDHEHGQALCALLGVLEAEYDLLEQDIARLLDDWFVETSDEWVIPYIGDLLGVRLLNTFEGNSLYSLRAYVANTISYRRRKGTLSVLEDLARDVTGWRSHAVAFFELIGWTQNLNHLRYETAQNPAPSERLTGASVTRVGTVNLRELDVVDRIDSAFDVCSHTADIRPIGQQEGWHNIRNLGLFVWRLQSYPMSGVTPAVSETTGEGFHFSPLGNAAPLFTNAERKDDELALSTERNVPGPIRPVGFFQSKADYYGSESDKSLAIYRGTFVDAANLIPEEQIICKDLSNWLPPPAGFVAVDVRLGRFLFAPGEVPAEGVTVSYHYGFSSDIGGGPYDRRAVIADGIDGVDFIATVAKALPDIPVGAFGSIGDAIDAWDPSTNPRAVITVADNATYDENLELSLEDGQSLVVQADNRNRPTIRLRDDAEALSALRVTGGNGEGAFLTLNGCLIEGSIHIDPDSLGSLEIIHSTLTPGLALHDDGTPFDHSAASLTVETGNDELEIEIASSIIGSMRIPDDITSLVVKDSIIDHPRDPVSGSRGVALAEDDAADLPGPVATLIRTTVFGHVYVRTLELASEVIFNQSVVSQRRQRGCVRYSYVDDLVSSTPRRFRCQPDLALANRRKLLEVDVLSAADAASIRSRVRPDFTSDDYGDPAYAQLSPFAGREVVTGAESGSEMGVFEHLKQPLRLANLRAALDEYAPSGLTTGILFVT